jgi:[acyl-carrier-protein] S-malonyltransferase
MASAGERLSAVLDKIAVKDPQVPVISNVEAKPYTEAGRIKSLLVAQISSPVLWESSVKEMITRGVTHFVETGPGKVLSGLVKKIDKGVVTMNFDNLAGFKAVDWEGA